MPCNPKNPKSQDPRYECNPLTNRWILRKNMKTIVEKVKMTTTKPCNSKNPKADDPRYECNPFTHRWILRKNMKMKTKTKRRITNVKQKIVDNWQTTCRKMESSCPMETDLTGDPWCSLLPKDVFYYVKNGKHYCYGVDDVFSIIHLGFTSRDTSFEVPPLRLQLPRDSYDRSAFTKDFFDAFQKHIQKHGQIPQEPEVCYFLRYYPQFYDDPVIQQFLVQFNPDKVKLSNAIDKFLMKHRYITMNLVSSQWYWRRNKRPQNMTRFLFGS